ncbi:hypothetical protein SZ54_0136 [Rhizobium sp. UR51a]|nr:hypothetical protein SZ54_0136 [Rhizobium sp. UR51a]
MRDASIHGSRTSQPDRQPVKPMPSARPYAVSCRHSSALAIHKGQNWHLSYPGACITLEGKHRLDKMSRGSKGSPFGKTARA